VISKFAAPDEREAAVANAAYRLGYIVVSFGVLLSAAYRGLVSNEAAWDLLAWVVLGGAVASVYQAQAQTLSRRWAAAALATAAVAAIVAILLVVLTR
jgi:hypothetical protein